MAKHPRPWETINSIYELLSIELTIRNLPAVAGFPTKSTCLKSIRQGNCTKKVANFSSESEETQKGHTRVQIQVFFSTKPVEPAKEVSEE